MDSLEPSRSQVLVLERILFQVHPYTKSESKIASLPIELFLEFRSHKPKEGAEGQPEPMGELWWVRIETPYADGKVGATKQTEKPIAGLPSAQTDLTTVFITKSGMVARQTAAGIIGAFNAAIGNIALEHAGDDCFSGQRLRQEVLDHHLEPLFRLKVGKFSLQDGITTGDQASWIIKTSARTKGYDNGAGTRLLMGLLTQLSARIGANL